MHLPPSIKLVAATWIAALIGALAGRTLAEASSTMPQDTHATLASGPLVGR
jgi:hypothetical protein